MYINIVDNTNRQIQFGDLRHGQVFIFAGRYYLTIEIDDEFMGVDLATGVVNSFDYICEVVTVDKATLTVE